MKKLSTIFLLVVFTISLNAQKQTPTPAPKCSMDLSRILVEQQVNESKSIDDTHNRIKILTLAADFFWKLDEATARKNLSDAYDFAESRFKENGAEIKSLGEGFSTTAEDIRFSVIKSIGKYDNAWAKKLTEKLLKEFETNDKDPGDRFDKANEVNETITFALSVYDQNPQFAISILRSVYKFPFSNRWNSVLLDISRKNQRDSDIIYSELLTNYANSPIEKLFSISDYPFGTGVVRGLGTSWSSDVPKTFVPNKELQQRFLDLILQRAVQYQPNSTEMPKDSWREPEVTHLFYALKTLEPIVIQKFANLANEWAAAKTQVAAYLSEKSKKRIESDDDWKSKSQSTFEKELEKLEKLDGEGKLNDAEIFNLVQTARKEEQYSKIEIWLEKIQDSKTRESIFLFFYFNRTQLAIREKRFSDAKKQANKIAKLEFRAVQMLNISQEKLKEKLGKVESEEILFDVYQTAIKSDNSVAKAQVLFGLAFVYESINHQQALESFRDGIQTINSIPASEDVFTSYLSIIVKYDDGITAMSFDSPGLNLEKVINELSKNDFNNTLNFANSFTDKYYRALSVIAIAKNCREVAKPAEKVIKIMP